jgi:hypothetical protein
MPTPEFTPLEPAVSKTRWIKPPFSYDDLHEKRVFARFTTEADGSYSGTGKIRVRRNPQGLLALDLVFTRVDRPYQWTDFVFHLSERQANHLQRAASDASYDYLYDGHLSPDNQPDAS